MIFHEVLEEVSNSNRKLKVKNVGIDEEIYIYRSLRWVSTTAIIIGRGEKSPLHD